MDDRYGREWRRGAIRAVLLAAVLILAVFGFLVYVLLASGEAEYWAGEIAEFERLDVSNPPEAGQIVFAGGGTIRKWETLARDLAPLPVLNRGFGGAHVSHVAAYAPRIILPYAPRAVVISAGADDLADVGGKPATLSTGAVIRVPLFVQEGEIAKVDTRTGEYAGRIKN